MRGVGSLAFVIFVMLVLCILQMKAIPLCFFMFLFMDVLFNQPRNAGSSTSLATSIALVLNVHNIKSISCCFHFTLVSSTHVWHDIAGGFTGLFQF